MARTTRRPPTTNRRSQLGALGEDLVAHWYERSGFTILDRNWRVRTGEIDLVAAQGRLVAFCEVKTRSSAAFGTGLDAVTPTKQRRLRMLGVAWLAAHPDVRPQSVRFDVASLTGDEIVMVIDAF